jgi:SAM-dependent methyltransferase
MTGRTQATQLCALRPQQVTREGFYRAFEERFRGSRELIRSRLRIYLPFIEPLKSIDDYLPAVDLGCGRGEWLELLKDSGFDAQGVDLDDGMLAACSANGLRVTKGDAIAFLKELPNESQSVVSGFHIAEHLPFSQLQILVEEALRVLKPAGLLILETPNPENIKVSSLTFYLDPTHHHPLPPELLSFLPEYYGFARIKVVRLQENQELLESQAASLDQVLGGVSPDYAVIGQKAADEAVARLFDSEFDKDFGLGAHVLVRRFDRQLAAQNERAAALEARVDERADALETRVDERADALETRVDEQLAALAADILIKNAALADIYASTSWRITAPMRLVWRAVRRSVRGSWAWLTLKPGSRPRRVARRGGVAVARFFLARPRLAQPAQGLLRRFPAINQRLRTMLPPAETSRTPILSDLSPRAREIYFQLRAAIAQNAERK